MSSSIQVLVAATPVSICATSNFAVGKWYLATPIQVSSVVVSDREI